MGTILDELMGGISGQAQQPDFENPEVKALLLQLLRQPGSPQGIATASAPPPTTEVAQRPQVGTPYTAQAQPPADLGRRNSEPTPMPDSVPAPQRQPQKMAASGPAAAPDTTPNAFERILGTLLASPGDTSFLPGGARDQQARAQTATYKAILKQTNDPDMAMGVALNPALLPYALGPKASDWTFQPHAGTDKYGNAIPGFVNTKTQEVKVGTAGVQAQPGAAAPTAAAGGVTAAPTLGATPQPGPVTSPAAGAPAASPTLINPLAPKGVPPGDAPPDNVDPKEWYKKQADIRSKSVADSKARLEAAANALDKIAGVHDLIEQPMFRKAGVFDTKGTTGTVGDVIGPTAMPTKDEGVGISTHGIHFPSQSTVENWALNNVARMGADGNTTQLWQGAKGEVSKQLASLMLDINKAAAANAQGGLGQERVALLNLIGKSAPDINSMDKATVKGNLDSVTENLFKGISADLKHGVPVTEMYDKIPLVMIEKGVKSQALNAKDWQPAMDVLKQAREIIEAAPKDQQKAVAENVTQQIQQMGFNARFLLQTTDMFHGKK